MKNSTNFDHNAIVSQATGDNHHVVATDAVSSVNKAGNSRPQCHVVSNTHWDREWRFSMQKVRHRLVYMLDQLFDILEKDPEFKSFHLDSQTVPIQDYLEIRPERRALFEQAVRDRRILVGPWFCLPDENCVGGEAIIRNLLLGHRMASEFGHVSKTGYSPFSWGQISQMPQIYQGFGIPFIAFYRGINNEVAPLAEFLWEGPDGTRITASRLGRRPRYNFYYIVQRAVFWGVEETDYKHEKWENGHGPWRMASPAFADRDYDYLHPRFSYHEDLIKAKARQAIEEQDGDWTTPHRFWSIGHDASFPDIRETAMIQDCQKSLAGEADVFHSSLEDFQRQVLENVGDNLPVIRGEMRHPSTDKNYSPLLGWVTSARMYIKQANFRSERELIRYAEPLALFAHLSGAPYPAGFLNTAYNWLLQNHGHDSIGGCSRDIIHKDMIYRYRQSDEIARCVTEEALLDICRAINFNGWKTSDIALVVYNPSAAGRTHISRCIIDIPESWTEKNFVILDENGHALAAQTRVVKHEHYGLLNAQGDVPTTLLSTRFHADVEFPDLPGFGYRTFRVVPRQSSPPASSLRTGIRTMQNEHVRVDINDNGTLKVFHKTTGKTYDGLGYFRNTSETGNPWEHTTVDGDQPLTSLDQTAQITLLEEGPVFTAFQIVINWKIPVDLSSDRKTRSTELVEMKIINTVSLRKNEPWVTVETSLDNQSRNHYLQVCFPTGISRNTIHVQTPFDVVERSCKTPDATRYAEVPQTEQPMDSFVDKSDGKTGLAILNEGLKAYEADDDADGTVRLTLLRCFTLLICQTWKWSDYSPYDPESQCPGPHTFKYAIMPHAGDWQTGNVWRESDNFNMDVFTAMMSPSGSGTKPLSHSFLDVSPSNLQVSAVKQSESGNGWVVRVFNPGDETVTARICLNNGKTPPINSISPIDRIRASYEFELDQTKRWRSARCISLEELVKEELPLDDNGATSVQVKPRQIVTVEFIS